MLQVKQLEGGLQLIRWGAPHVIAIFEYVVTASDGNYTLYSPHLEAILPVIDRDRSKQNSF